MPTRQRRGRDATGGAGPERRRESVLVPLPAAGGLTLPGRFATPFLIIRNG
jgi:hypothetical protein